MNFGVDKTMHDALPSSHEGENETHCNQVLPRLSTDFIYTCRHIQQDVLLGWEASADVTNFPGCCFLITWRL